MNSSVEVQPIGEPEREKWPDLAARLANIIAHYPVHQRGDLAQLRRMNPESPNAPAFWRLLHRHGLGRTQENERRWGTILQAIAIMTPNANTKDNVQSAHNPRRPFGRSLYEGNGKGRMPLCREGRLHQMLGSREHIFRRNFMIIMRMLAQNGAQVDWREAARLVLDEGRNLKAMEDHVRRVYRLYYQAEYHAENRDRDEGQQALAA